MLSPERPDIRTNLAYALLKTGENEAPAKSSAKRRASIPRISTSRWNTRFSVSRLGRRPCAQSRSAAYLRARARHRRATPLPGHRRAGILKIDEPLRQGIARWQQVARNLAAPTFSAHYELAQLAEERDELDLAATQYRGRVSDAPERKSVLLELARVEKARNNAGGRHGRAARRLAGRRTARRRDGPRATARAISVCLRIPPGARARSRECRAAPRTGLSAAQNVGERHRRGVRRSRAGVREGRRAAAPEEYLAARPAWAAVPRPMARRPKPCRF